MKPWLKPVENGVELLIWAQPRASRSRVVGEHDGRLKIQLAAPPVDGEANAELLSFLAGKLRLKRAQVVLLEGDTGRRKRVRLEGVDVVAVETALS